MRAPLGGWRAGALLCRCPRTVSAPYSKPGGPDACSNRKPFPRSDSVAYSEACARPDPGPDRADACSYRKSFPRSDSSTNIDPRA